MVGGVLGSMASQPDTVYVQQPVYAQPAPVVVQSGPGYYAQPVPAGPVYVQPAPVYVQPSPVIVGPPPPVYYGPRPAYQVRYW